MAEQGNTNRVFTKGLLLGIVLIVVLLIFNAGLAFWNTRRVAEDAALVTHTNAVLDALDDILTTMTEAVAGERGYLITGEDQYPRTLSRRRSGDPPKYRAREAADGGQSPAAVADSGVKKTGPSHAR